MKVYGKRILDSNLRFTYEVDGDEVSAADKARMEKVDKAVGEDTSLSSLVEMLSPLVDSEGEVRVRIEPTEFE